MQFMGQKKKKLKLKNNWYCLERNVFGLKKNSTVAESNMFTL